MLTIRVLILVASLLVWVLPCTASEIHEAVTEGDLELVAQLLKEDPSRVNEQADNPTRDLPLHTAAFLGQMEIAELLLEAGADVNCGDADESTPLDVAALKQHKEMVVFLLANGADPNHRDNNLAYSLSFAAFGGDAETVQILIDAGADLAYENERGLTLVHAAAARGLIDFLEYLVAAGQDINTRSAEGETPLQWAAARGQTAMVQLLVDQGADVNNASEQGETPLMVAAYDNNAEVAEILLVAGAEVDAADNWSNTALLRAARGGRTEYAEVLLKHQADPDKANDNGVTSLVEATNRGHTPVVIVLLDAGASVDSSEQHYGYTALHVAAERGYTDIAAALVANGASLNAKDSAGHTPLQLAAVYGQKETVNLLLKEGADEEELTSLPPTTKADCKVDQGEAVVWYLGHSGVGIRTANHFLVFDHFLPERMPDHPCLRNGNVCPAELQDLDVTVFASHDHGDHYDPAIFEWREKKSDITYVLGCQPEDVTGYEYMGPREKHSLGDMKITTIESNDSGVGFVVEVDGLVIFHAGDHANRQQDFSGPYKLEIDYLAAAGIQPDLAFMPIRGCGFGDQEAVKMGVHYALKELEPKVFIPMHAGSAGYHYREFIDACSDQFPKTEMVAMQHQGNNFRYVQGSQVIGMAR